MLKRLIDFLKNNYPDTDINEYLDSKYIHLDNDKLQKIAIAINDGSLKIKPASSCVAVQFLFHFGSTIILLKKKDNNFVAELAWETDFLSIHSVRDKTKGFYFIKFEFDDNYQIKLLETDKKQKSQVRSLEKEEELLIKIMPIIKGFISAIAE